MRRADFKEGLYTMTRSTIWEVPLEERQPHCIGYAIGIRKVSNKEGTSGYYVTDLFDKNGNVIANDVPITRLRNPLPGEIEFFNNGGTKFKSVPTRSVNPGKDKKREEVEERRVRRKGWSGVNG